MQRGFLNLEINPEFSDDIYCCAMDFMAGAEWRRYHRKASNEEVDEASIEYGRQQVQDFDDNPDAVDDTAMGFREGAEWYVRYMSVDYSSDRIFINLYIGMCIAIVLFIYLVFRHG